MAEFAELIARQRALGDELLPGTLERVDWTGERVLSFRQEALRALLAFVKEKSAWYGKRLDHMDCDRATEADLASIPPMTKADLMTNFDAIVTDPRLSRALCERHLLVEAAGGGYLHDEYRVVASGGSDGLRALVVLGWVERAIIWTESARFLIRWQKRMSKEGKLVTASVTAAHNAHLTRQWLSDFGRATFSVTQPVNEVVAGLNRIQPKLLIAYPSILPRLAREADEGRLQIKPEVCVTVSEPLLPEHEEAIAHAWGCPTMNCWGATEVGLLGMGSGFDRGMLLLDDEVVIEPVDADGQPVGSGQRAAKLYVTPLFKRVLPVIRYEVTDQFMLLDSPAICGSAFRRISNVEGRYDDLFRYDRGVEVHPHFYRSIFTMEQSVLEYQVRQTENGANISVVIAGRLDLERIRRTIENGLSALGVRAPDVQLVAVAEIHRSGASQKLKRFVPLAPAARQNADSSPPQR
jgi:phenylacetate-coenzyme A ligase PaaK-like adenylate-forming protein